MPNGVQFPYGDAFIVGTPNLDRLSQKLYQEQKQRELYQQQQNKMLDDEFARNMSGIRDADIGDLTKAYGDFKIAHQQLQKDKNATPDKQLDVLRKKASVYDIINKSKQDKDWEDAQAKQIMTDRKGYYADNAHDLLVARRNTPVSKIDRTKDGDLLYKYYLPEFDKINKEAIGAPLEKRGTPKVNGINDETPVYKVGNSPNQQYDHLYKSFASKNRDAAGLIDHSFSSDQDKEDLMNQYYAKIKDPKFIAAYGDVQPFPQSALQTDLGKAVALQVMRNVVDTPIPEAKIEIKANPDRATKNRQQFAIEQQARAQKNSIERLYINADVQGKNPQVIEQNIDNLINQHIQDAKNNGEVLVDAATWEALTGLAKQKTSYLTVDESGNYKYGKKNLETGAVENLTPIPFELAKTKLTQKYKSGLDSHYNTGDKKPTGVGKKKVWNPKTGKFE